MSITRSAPEARPPFAAHTPNAAGDWHPLEAHLRGVARRARSFGDKFGAGELAHAEGLLHDVGKFGRGFQAYLDDCHQAHELGTKPPGKKVDHSSAGAVEALGLWQGLAFPIAGHHAGLQDMVELKERLTRKASDQSIQECIEAARQALPELRQENDVSSILKDQALTPLEAEFLLRMLLSVLVDADRLDTEEHGQADAVRQRSGHPSLHEMWERFRSAQDSLLEGAEDTPVNRIRREVYAACLKRAHDPPGLFSLTVPTGGGKTLSGLGFALRHAVNNGLDRVIVAIPYTSIIEQTAAVYRAVLGDDAVLEHHSATAFEEDEQQDAGTLSRRLAAENWDVPLVVTTTVQLFESLFSNSPGRCRKLHNVARSVIILDEVQTLPLHLVNPILDVLNCLVRRYETTVVLCTATQPLFEDNGAFNGGFPGGSTAEIVPAYKEHFQALKRVEYTIVEEPWGWDRVAEEMRSREQALVIVNTRKDALALFDHVASDHTYHLSTLLCPRHRSDILKEIRRRLMSKEPCYLVATQVVEAGVDLDFPLVLRALGPLDRIVQAGGRCNREGKLPGTGRVVVFRPLEGGSPRGSYRTAIDRANAMLKQDGIDLHDPVIFKTYFANLFRDVNLDKHAIQKSRAQFEFEKVGTQFRLIEDDTVSVVVEYGAEARSLLDSAVHNINRKLMRQLQPYFVSLRRPDLDKAGRRGHVQELASGLYKWTGAYHPKRGLTEVVYDPSDLCLSS